MNAQAFSNTYFYQHNNQTADGALSILSQTNLEPVDLENSITKKEKVLDKLYYLENNRKLK